MTERGEATPTDGDPASQPGAGIRGAALRQVVRDFTILYDDLLPQTLGATRWLGQAIVKPPQDMVMLQEIVFETEPDLIIETGVFGGGSAMFFASLLDLIGGEGKVIGVDLNVSTVPAPVIDHPRIELIEGSSTAPEVVGRLEDEARDRRVMVDLDSDHSAAHVADELRALAPLVSPGCYLVVEDTWIGGNPVSFDDDPGPARALEDWLSTGQPFTVDRWRERLLLTSNPGGYLLRSGSEGLRRPQPRRDEFVVPALDRAADVAEGAAASPADVSGSPAEVIGRLAAGERRLQDRLAAETAAHGATVNRLEAEIDKRGRMLAESEQRVRDLRARLRGRQESSLTNLPARLRAAVRGRRDRPPGGPDGP